MVRRTVQLELVGDLETDGFGYHDHNNDLDFRYAPVHVPVMNDGMFRHWVIPGERYRVNHDGIGWRVTCEIWDKHVRRLADESGAFVSELPGAGGPISLEPGVEYEIDLDHLRGVLLLSKVL